MILRLSLRGGAFSFSNVLRSLKVICLMLTLAPRSKARLLYTVGEMLGFFKLFSLMCSENVLGFWSCG